MILVIDHDPDLRGALELLLIEEGHQVMTAADGNAALSLVARAALRPDIILADYNLPSGPNGLATAGLLREQLHRHTPVIILTGDISTEAKQHIAGQDCLPAHR